MVYVLVGGDVYMVGPWLNLTYCSHLACAAVVLFTPLCPHPTGSSISFALNTCREYREGCTDYVEKGAAADGTSAVSDDVGPQVGGGNQTQALLVLVQIGHLKSYEHVSHSSACLLLKGI